MGGGNTDDRGLERLLKEVAGRPSWLAPRTTPLDGRLVIKCLPGSCGMGADVVFRLEGTLDKYVGDAILKTYRRIIDSGFECSAVEAVGFKGVTEPPKLYYVSWQSKENLVPWITI